MNGERQKPQDRLLRALTYFFATGAAATLIAAAAREGLQGTAAQVFLTFTSLAAAAGILRLQLWDWRTSGGARPSKLRTLGIAAVFVSQVSFLILVWSHWRTWAAPWRFWWVSAVPTVFVTHLLMIRAAGRGRWGGVELANGAAALTSGLMVLYLGLRPDVFAKPGRAFSTVLGVSLAVSTLLSIYLGVRAMVRAGVSWKPTRRALIAWAALSYVVVATLAFYLGRATASTTTDFSHGLLDVLRAAPADVADRLEKDAYHAQSTVAEYLGDTKIVEREPYITFEQIAGIENLLEPGDILLERRNWYLSNPWLPGFWPHAALYVGTIEDLKALGIADHPAIAPHLAEYLAPAADGHAKVVIEAVSEGVLFNSLFHSMHADYAAALRPKVSREAKAEAIVRAFGNLGKLYDFNFDFDDETRLVCTQVVYLSYRGALDLPLQRVMGRNTLPANEIARKFAVEAALTQRQLDFVFFLDTVASEGGAVVAGEGDFSASVERPRELVER